MAQPIPTTMGALVIEGPRRASVQTVPTPAIGDEDVLIEVEGCGVCGSNLPVWQGREWFRYPLPPGNPGHEGWGVVAAKGANVAAVRVGDRVSFLSDRAFAQFASAPESAVVRLPLGLSGAKFPGEALGCIMNVFRRSKLEPGQRVAIVGVGFLGAGLVALASRAGAKVTAISRRPWALELARELGAEHAVVMGDDDEATLSAVMEANGGQPCQQVIEAVGAQRALDLASALVATHGRLIIAGYHQDGTRVVDLQSWNWRGLDVINAHEREQRTQLEGIRAAVDAVSCKALRLEQLVSHTFDLAHAADAFWALEQRPDGFLKAVLRP